MVTGIPRILSGRHLFTPSGLIFFKLPSQTFHSFRFSDDLFRLVIGMLSTLTVGRHVTLSCHTEACIITMLMSGNWLTCFCLWYKCTANALCIGSRIYISSPHRSLIRVCSIMDFAQLTSELGRLH